MGNHSVKKMKTADTSLKFESFDLFAIYLVGFSMLLQTYLKKKTIVVCLSNNS